MAASILDRRCPGQHHHTATSNPSRWRPAGSDGSERVGARARFETALFERCRPGLVPETTLAQRTFCQRIDRFLAEFFPFVLYSTVPADNNLAERSLRPLVVARKISGGTRSSTGSRVRLALASLFGTWQAQGGIPSTPVTNCSLSPHSELLPRKRPIPMIGLPGYGQAKNRARLAQLFASRFDFLTALGGIDQFGAHLPEDSDGSRRVQIVGNR